jgi:hypothetical protein
MDEGIHGFGICRPGESLHPASQATKPANPPNFMPQREFEITIAPNGSVEVHVKGYKGRSCLEAMKIFEKVVGEMKSQRETSEFYEPDEHVQFNLEQRH